MPTQETEDHIATKAMEVQADLLILLPNARRQLQAARNRGKGNHARIEGAPTDSCTP